MKCVHLNVVCVDALGRLHSRMSLIQTSISIGNWQLVYSKTVYSQVDTSNFLQKWMKWFRLRKTWGKLKTFKSLSVHREDNAISCSGFWFVHSKYAIETNRFATQRAIEWSHWSSSFVWMWRFEERIWSKPLTDAFVNPSIDRTRVPCAHVSCTLELDTEKWKNGIIKPSSFGSESTSFSSFEAMTSYILAVAVACRRPYIYSVHTHTHTDTQPFWKTNID